MGLKLTDTSTQNPDEYVKSERGEKVGEATKCNENDNNNNKKGGYRQQNGKN